MIPVIGFAAGPREESWSPIYVLRKIFTNILIATYLRNINMLFVYGPSVLKALKKLNKKNKMDDKRLEQ
jgi:hypothetical protein